jgi:histidine ammonia-lyase
MTVVLTGSALTLDELVRVARDGEAVALAPGVVERMARSRAAVDAALARGDPVYGLTTGVGVLKRVPLAAAEVARFNRRLLENHRVAQGPPVAPELVRATMLRLANGFAAGHAGVRPALAERLVEALDRGDCPVVRELGSLGESDLAPLADLAAGLFGDPDLAAGEGLALLNNNAFSTAAAALAVHDAGRLLKAADAAAALSLEAFAANLSILHPAIVAARPDEGLAHTVDHLRELLDGSYLWRAGAARNLQDPLTFRSLAGVHGACHDALSYVRARLAVELNAAQGNPLVVPGEQRLISVANFEALALAAALDLARIALAPLLTSADERVVKLLETPWSGLPTGLADAPGTPESGLSIYAIAGEAMTAEARLLAQPVSFELASSAGAEGIEDRATMLPLGARRLAAMAGLGEHIVAIELLVAAQAVELRGSGPLGRGTRRVFESVRERVPFVGQDDPLPADLEGLVELIRAGALAESADAASASPAPSAPCASPTLPAAPVP